MIYIGIDPSINTTGLAAIDLDRNIKYLSHTTKISCKRFANRVYSLERAWQCMMYNLFPGPNKMYDTCAIIEMPERQTSLKGRLAYETNKYVKLCAAFGAWVGFCIQMLDPKKVYCIPVSKWKGQVSKYITRKRMIAKYTNDTARLNRATHDEIDALALADWLYENHQSLSTRKTS